jgi:hypothetical protein
MMIASLIMLSLEFYPKQRLYISLDEDIVFPYILIYYQDASPEETANLFSKIYFQWMSPLMSKGYTKLLDMHDLYNIKKEESAYVNSEKFQHVWKAELASGKYTLQSLSLF